jgi:hypothetical protein
VSCGLRGARQPATRNPQQSTQRNSDPMAEIEIKPFFSIALDKKRTSILYKRFLQKQKPIAM